MPVKKEAFNYLFTFTIVLFFFFATFCKQPSQKFGKSTKKKSSRFLGDIKIIFEPFGLVAQDINYHLKEICIVKMNTIENEY